MAQNSINGIHAGNIFIDDVTGSSACNDGVARLMATSTGIFQAQWDQNSSGTYASNAISFKPANLCTADDGATTNKIWTTATTVPFGTVTPNTFYQGCQDLTVSTNAPGGYSLTVQESSAMRTASGGFTIPDTMCDNGDCSVVTATTWVTPTKNGFGHTCWNVSGSDCNASFLNGTQFKPVPNVAAGTGPGTVSLVQSAQRISSGNNVSKAFSSNNTAGDLLVVAAGWDGDHGPVSISDTLGNLYATAVGPFIPPGTNDNHLQIFYAANSRPGANTVTVNLYGGSSSFLDLFIHEYSGADITAPLDRTATGTSNGTAISTNLVNTTQDNELLFGFATAPNVTGAGGGFTLREKGSDGNATEERVVGSRGSYSANFTTASGYWVAELATFKAAPPATYAIMASSTPALATGRVKYRLSVPSSAPAGTCTTIIRYILTPTY